MERGGKNFTTEQYIEKRIEKMFGNYEYSVNVFENRGAIITIFANLIYKIGLLWYNEIVS